MTNPRDGETHLTFPCEFTIKIIGKDSADFEGEVVALVRQHFPNLGEGAVKQNKSKEKTYLALSIKLWVEDKPSLDALYKDLSENPLVLFAL